VLLALIVGGYGYFFDHGLLKTIGLGSLVAADDAKAAAAAAPPEPAQQVGESGALIKCVDSNGNVTFTNHPCPNGEKAHKVKLSDTQIVHMGPSASPNTPNQGGQKDNDGHNQTVHSDKEPQKVNAKGALYEKFMPQ
jgi:hypothetical protein